ncbi:hypothetical protein DFH07DRAFT_865695 [Mycena maculata]|uniref:Enoyl reductase (ER) domain-containing protein n=1 Tax=Mycena maculata TaxID=230809 RepID=A0AAD7K690_9AGAR|nr:hypothetical protein DFH07DRAFT_865695 [Mycena maculata]
MILPTTTRQYCYPEPGSSINLILQEVPIGTPKSNEVLVRTRAVSLQFGGLLIARGDTSLLPPNLVPCSDMAGEVIAVGENVKRWSTGDRVCGNPTFGKLYELGATGGAALGRPNGVLTEYRIFPMPSHLSYEEVSTLPSSALTAYNALSSGFQRLQAGDTVLVQGTGASTSFALQFAIASGATVIATSSSDEKLKIATKLGAKHAINYNTTPDWDEEVLKLTNGLGVDCVIEVGGNKTLKRSLAAVKRAGSVDLIGVLGGMRDIPPPDIVMPCILKEVSIRGVWSGAAHWARMSRLISANAGGVTRPVIDKVFEFEQAKEALAYLELHWEGGY